VRLLVISGAYPPMRAGESSNAHHLCRQLAARGIDVQVLTTVGNTGGNDAGVTVHAVMPGWGWSGAPRFARFLKACRPDAILLMFLGGMYDYHPMMTFAATIAHRVLPGVPFVTRYESPFAGAAPKSTLGGRIGRKAVTTFVKGEGVTYTSGSLLRDSNRVIVLCEGHKRVLEGEWAGSSDKIIVVPPPPNIVVCPDTNGVARRKGRERLGIGVNELVIAFFGYVYPKKGIEVLLEAFQSVGRSHADARLVFIGGTIDLDAEVSARYWDQMQELTKRLGIADRTKWTGAFDSSGSEGSEYLRAADICVLPLLKGVQLNNSSFSAMAAHGVPIITTRGDMTDAAFVDGENVVLAEPGNATALADSIVKLMNDEALRARLRTGIARLASEWLSWDRGLDRTLAAFEPPRSRS